MGLEPVGGLQPHANVARYPPRQQQKQPQAPCPAHGDGEGTQGSSLGLKDRAAAVLKGEVGGDNGGGGRQVKMGRRKRRVQLHRYFLSPLSAYQPPISPASSLCLLFTPRLFI